jgi:hypothetical protein
MNENNNIPHGKLGIAKFKHTPTKKSILASANMTFKVKGLTILIRGSSRKYQNQMNETIQTLSQIPKMIQLIKRNSKVAEGRLCSYNAIPSHTSVELPGGPGVRIIFQRQDYE